MTASTATAPVTARQIADALTAAEGNKARAAELVRLNRSTFNRRLAALAEEIEAILAGAGDEDHYSAEEIEATTTGGGLYAPADDETAGAEVTGRVDDEPAVEADGHEHDGKVTECQECGFEFSRPQNRRTCKAPAACKRRQAARAAAE